MKKLSKVLVVVMILNALSLPSFAEEVEGFSDVPIGDWSEVYINKLKGLGVTNGVGNNEYGYDQTLTREEFVAFLYKLNKWESVVPETNSFQDVTLETHWSYQHIETALSKGIIDLEDGYFRPKENITREEIALMIIKSLGYDWLADQRNDIDSPFEDVTEHVGYISLLKDFGIVNGKSSTTFDPGGYAKRQEAAAILVRMYDMMKGELDETNVFYSQGSYSNIDLMTSFDKVSFNWAALDFDDEGQVFVDTRFPDGYTLATSPAIDNGMKLELSILSALSDQDSTYGSALEKVLETEESMDYLVQEIGALMDEYTFFTGLVIDFEGLQSGHKESFVNFLEKLSPELTGRGKSLTVMVQPYENYWGYDYGKIVAIADQMILMAHDYAPISISDEERLNTLNTNTPVAPIELVYDAMKALVDDIKYADGVEVAKDQVQEALSKVSLQISFDSAQWKIDADGVITENAPYTPSYDKIFARLVKEGTEVGYGPTSKSPFASYIDDDGLDNILWYEDTRSIQDKIDLAGMLGIRDVSVWFLGSIPDFDGGQEVDLDVMRLFE